MFVASKKLTPGKSFKNDLRATLDLKQNSALHKKDQLIFFKRFLRVLTTSSFCQEDWASGYHSTKV